MSFALALPDDELSNLVVDLEHLEHARAAEQARRPALNAALAERDHQVGVLALLAELRHVKPRSVIWSGVRNVSTRHAGHTVRTRR